ncbi:hypothetical protein GY45DRAFT_1075402 [Cubamyces sp. BRFM 1775]|nr:hypothetical protein GY45DRAFT_1075402 [Cubamyces sp. BRFM 1775]
MEYLHDQTPDDARNWLQLQTDMLGACFSRQEATCCADTMLRYVGTAATVRDVVAMADAFDGLGSAVNLWGTESGARVGAYLLKMFPERAGRVILDAPEDLQAYLHGYSYETWKTALQHAHEALSQFVETCVLSDGELEQDCSRYVHDEVLDDDNLGMTQMLLFSAVRNKYIGWRNAREVDLNNTRLTSAFKAPTKFGNRSFDAVLGLNRLQHIEHVDGLDLGMMPVFCGDQTSEYSPESAAAGTHQIAERLRDDIGFAPLFGEHCPSLPLIPHRILVQPS